jgi:uncharacterized membrane protein (UPF0127 family)
MRVINKTAKKTLCKSSELCITAISKAQGLMFSRRLKNHCLIFEFQKPRKAYLHMFFVFFSIDILFLDPSKTVIGLLHHVKPFTPYIASKIPVKYVLELPKGKLRSTNTREGHKIDF